MFIKCQHCKATYKIDVNKIPSEKSYVKCSNCSKPIPLNPNVEENETVEPKGHVVECDNCSSRYLIPLETIAHKALKVRCGKCSNLFTVPALDQGMPEDKTIDGSDLESDSSAKTTSIDQDLSFD